MSDCHCTTCQLDTIITLLHTQGDQLVALQDDLTEVKANLTEATTELTARIDELVAQVQAGQVDPQLVADVKGLAAGLADIVPDAPPE